MLILFRPTCLATNMLYHCFEQSENQQYLLNAAAFEEYPLHDAPAAADVDAMHVVNTRTPSSLNLSFDIDMCTEIQERSKRESHLEESQIKMQRTIQSLRYSLEVQHSSFVKVMKLLKLPAVGLSGDVDMESFISTNMSMIEARVNELLASSDAEKVRLCRSCIGSPLVILM